MNPDNDTNSPLRSPVPAERPTTSPAQISTPRVSTQEAAANIVRSQIDSLYGTPQASTPVNQQATNDARMDVSPYDRTHTEHVDPTQADWQKYHSAWQTYYQKYYEGYYTHHLEKAKKTIAEHPQTEPNTYFVDQPIETPEQKITKDQALYDLRQKLLIRVQDSAKKVRGSRHFIPITAALVVVLLFVFLQYNRVFIGTVQAYISPGSIDPQNIVIDPTADVAVGPESRLIIPKINVDVPVIYDVGNDYASQMKAMESGVANFAIPGASSRPGQIGNTPIAGHSSNDILDAGDYKFIFAQLEKLVPGDSIYAHYGGKRYTYTITKTETVKPTEVNKLVYPTTKSFITLITCTPVGTTLNRLLVTAEQVSPDPALSAPAPAVSSTVTSVALPGNSPTFIERLFGAE